MNRPDYSVRITGSGGAVGVVALLVLGVAGLTTSRALGAIGALALALLVVSFLARPAMAWGVSLTGPSRSVEGEPVEHLATVVNKGRSATPPVVLTVSVEGFAPVELALPGLRRDQACEASVVLRPVRRGPVRTMFVTRVTDAPFGLVRRSVSTLDEVSGVVHPPRRVGIPLPGLPGGDRPAGAPDRAGAPYHAVREYRPGDTARDVYWRSTAKRGQLVVMEREREESPQPLVVLCGPSAPIGTDPHWEQLIARLGWSLAAAVAAGCRPRFVVLGVGAPAGTEPGGVVLRSESAALDAAALVDGAAAPTVDDLAALAARVPRAGQVVVFAPEAAAYERAFAEAGLRASVVTA